MTRIITAVFGALASACAFASSVNVADFGAVSDGSRLTTDAIQRAVDACASSGGGTVFVPEGTYLVGTINLRSDVEFRMEHGAVLKATTDLSAYQRHNEQLAGVFYTDGADNVKVTGGTIDGQGLAFMDTAHSKTVGSAEKKNTRQGMDFRNAPGAPDDGPYEPMERYHQMIVFTECTNLVLEDFTCVNSPYWCFVIVHSSDIRISGLDIFNDLMIPNSDGIDLISCSNATISDCHIYAGDDCIVVAGYGWHQGDPGFKNIKAPSRNVNVTNCVLQSRSSGIRVGGHDQNPMSDYNFSDITIFDSNRGINISVSDSCSLENVTFSNIHIETRLHTGDWWGQGEPINITAMQLVPGKPVIGRIRNLHFNNITCTGENSVVMIADPQTVIENVFFSNFDFVLRKSAIEDEAGGNYDLRLNVHPDRSLYAADEPVFYIENARNVFFSNGTIGWDGADKSYHTYAVDAVKVKNLVIDNVVASPSPAHPDFPAVRTTDCEGAEIRLIGN